MQVLVCVINKDKYLEPILQNFINEGIRGATVIDSMGMAGLLSENDQSSIPAFASIRMILNENRPFNKTIFVVLNEEQVIAAINCIKEVIKNINDPNEGILFTLPVNRVEGGMIQE